MNEILQKIKQRGHWHVRFTGADEYKERFASPVGCDDFIRNQIVSLRGWNYPHYPREDATFGPNYCQGTVDWQGHIQLWRLYQSGQYVDYLALREDWIAEDTWFARDSRYAGMEPGTLLFIIGTVYTLTEVFEFLRRLTTQGLTPQGLYGNAVTVNIELVGTEGRRLYVDEFRRAPLLRDYVAQVPAFSWEKTYSREDVRDKAADLALEVVQKVFLHFQWGRQPVASFKQDQQELLKGL